jgi:hypothetical protein
MGSSKYRAQELPSVIRDRLDEAIKNGMTIIVGEAHGSCRLFQDYLVSKNYKEVVLGHARSIRYNAGNWKTIKYGDNLKEREKNMIFDCDVAIIIWQDKSGVIAENLELLKKLRKPTYLYEYYSSDGSSRYGELDPNRRYSNSFMYRKYQRKKVK